LTLRVFVFRSLPAYTYLVATLQLLYQHTALVISVLPDRIVELVQLAIDYSITERPLTSDLKQVEITSDDPARGAVYQINSAQIPRLIHNIATILNPNFARQRNLNPQCVAIVENIFDRAMAEDSRSEEKRAE